MVVFGVVLLEGAIAFLFFKGDNQKNSLRNLDLNLS